MATYVFDAYGTLYDVQSVSDATNEAFPGKGELITQVWRLKQLEYTWLRSLAGIYADFWQVTRESLEFAVQAFDVDKSPAVLDRVCEKYLDLATYPETKQALTALKERGHTLAILSNGEQAMLDRLVENSGLSSLIDRTLSVDEEKVFKPDRRAYELVGKHLEVDTADVTFVSSNCFDVVGARSFGFTVAWIRRFDPQAMIDGVAADPHAGPLTMFKLLRMQEEKLGHEANHKVARLTDLLDLPPAA